MKDRIRQLMDAQRMNQQAFAACTGISSASLSSIFTGRTNPTLNHVDAILNKFPEVNPMWLLKGVGGMLMTNSSGESDASSGSVASHASDTANPGSGDLFSPVDGDLFTSAIMAEDNNGTTSNNTSLQGRTGVVGSTRAQQSSFRNEQSQRSSNQQKQNGFQQQVMTMTGVQRKITEIRVFYDDQTWESFVPKK